MKHKIIFSIFLLIFFFQNTYSQNYYFKISGYKYLIFDRDNSKVYEFSQSQHSGYIRFYTYKVSDISFTDPEANNDIEIWETFDSHGSRMTFRVDIRRETIDYIEVDFYKKVYSNFIKDKLKEWEEISKK